MASDGDNRAPPDFIAKILELKSDEEIEALRQQVMPLILSDEPIFNPYEVIPHPFSASEREELIVIFPNDTSAKHSDEFLRRAALAIGSARRLRKSQCSQLSNKKRRANLKSLRKSVNKTYEIFLELPPELHYNIDFHLQSVWNARRHSLGEDMLPFARRMDAHYSDVTVGWIDTLLSQLTDLAVALDSSEEHLKKAAGGPNVNIAMAHLALRVAESYRDCFQQMPTSTEGKNFELVLEFVARIADIRDKQEASVMGYVADAVSQLKMNDEQG